MRNEQLCFVKSSRGGRHDLNLYQATVQGNGIGVTEVDVVGQTVWRK